MSEKRILIAGLPSSGKSTYVGLLFTAIEARVGSLRLKGFQGDLQYVNALADRLARCEEATRTDVDRADGFSAELDTVDGSEFFLGLPDYSGETWKTALEAHGWSEAIDAAVRDSSGLCLFVKVGAIDNDGTIADARRLTESLNGDWARPIDGPVDGVEEQNSPQDISPPRSTASTQISLVALLQVLLDRRGQDTCRLSVVISAFDLAGDITPANWISMNLPLLDQFLRANSPELLTRVFGVSAQGGKFNDSDSKVELLGREVLDRAFACDADGHSVDVDTPILWASGMEERA